MSRPSVLRVNQLRRRAAALATSIETVIAFDSAVSLAYKERTGLELQPDEVYTSEDAARAEEILLLFPK